MSVVMQDRSVVREHRSRSFGDALSLYMQEIECIPVLAPEEERELSRQFQKGDEAAFEKMVRHNLRFVVKIARQFRRPGIQLEDLINEGNLGLIQATRRFDPDRGCRLVTYARWWIRQCIFNYLTDRSRLVRIPSDKVYSMIRMVRSKDALLQQLGRNPGEQELAKALHCKPDQVKQLQEMPVAACSLSEPSNTEESTFELDTLQDDSPPSDEEVTRSERTHSVKEALAQLDNRERDVLLRYYGFDGQDPETLQGIGKDWGITRERVRQLRERALEKIRNSPISGQLCEFVS